jgi:hypothetical protein
MNSATSQTSAAWLPVKQSVGNGFTTQFQFQISPPAGGGPIADGFAFVIQNGPAASVALGTTGAGGYLGYEGLPNSIAFEFDTYQDSWDPNGNHVAVQSNGALPNTANHQTANLAVVNSTISTNLSDGATHTAVITYDATGGLFVFLDGTRVLAVSILLNNLLTLDAGGNAVVGFTAATGSYSEVTQISGWSFTSNQP